METPQQPRSTDEDAHRFLTIYLGDHLGGSSAGLALVRRCRRSNSGTDLDRVLAQIEADIEADRRSLEDLMVRLGVTRSRFKQGAGRLAELVGRVKTNGTIFRYSPLSRVVELEGLASGIITKRSLWRSLLTIADHDEALDTAELEALIVAATSQYERVMAEHDRAAASGFATSTR